MGEGVTEGVTEGVGAGTETERVCCGTVAAATAGNSSGGSSGVVCAFDSDNSRGGGIGGRDVGEKRGEGVSRPFLMSSMRCSNSQSSGPLRRDISYDALRNNLVYSAE